MKKDRRSNIFNTLTINVESDQRKELFLTVTSLLDSVRSGHGCLKFDFYEDTESQNSFLLIGEWESEEAWDHHLKSEEFAILLGALKLLAKRSSLDFNVLSSLPIGIGEASSRTEQAQALLEHHSQVRFRI